MKTHGTTGPSPINFINAKTSSMNKAPLSTIILAVFFFLEVMIKDATRQLEF